MRGEPRLPATIVTGFLGSGKTTFVNHILARQTERRIAVMVNEIGDIAIDNDLIIGAGDDMVELANGCICCSINGDLVDAIFRVLRREPPIDYLVVETTGLADPLPIVLTFLRPEFRAAIRVDSIVALADAESFSLDLFDSKPARNQLRFADFVLLNKCDLVAPARADAVEEQIRAVAEAARIVRVTRGEAPLPLILGAGLFDADRVPPERDHEHDGDHLAADGFDAVSFQSDRAFSPEKFQSFLEGLSGNVFRAKGVLAIDGAGRHIFHLVANRFTLDTAPATIGGPNRLVLIGRNLDAERLRAELASCLAANLTRAAE
jgi:G3E family GTPase